MMTHTPVLHLLTQTAQAQLAAEKADEAALVSEERVKALKWELMRKLTVSSTAMATSTGSGGSIPVATSLARAESSSPRATLNWKLRDTVTLRRSSTTTLPRSSLEPVATSTKQQRPHAQSDSVVPHTQTHSSQDSKTMTSLQVGPELTQSDSKARAKNVSQSNTSDHEKGIKAAELTAEPNPATVQSSSSSAGEKPASKYPALSRKTSTRAPASAPAQALRESKGSASDQSEPESEGSARSARSQKHPDAHKPARREAEQKESERDDSEREASGGASRTSRADEEVLAFTTVEDDSS